MLLCRTPPQCGRTPLSHRGRPYAPALPTSWICGQQSWRAAAAGRFPAPYVLPAWGTRAARSAQGVPKFSPSLDVSDVRSTDITIDEDTELWARVYCPSVPAADAARFPLPVLVYFHGGGFTLFSASSRPYDAFCRRLCCKLRAVVVSVSYRLAPKYRFPAAYDDGVAALHYLNETDLPLPADLEPVPAVDLSSCFLVGDSSGGNIVHHVAQRWASSMSSATSLLPQRPPMRVRLRLAGAIMIQPFFGGEERTESEVAFDKARLIMSVARGDHSWREFLPEGATRDHPAAHVCGEAVELADTFPPAMVVCGGIDPLRDWHARYVETLRAKGKLVRVVDYPEAFHGFYAYPERADSGELIQDIKLFLDDHSSKASLVSTISYV